jgi:AcrR family transcriptional regulator
VERRAEAERRLVEAAAELISEDGPSEVTMAKVGTRAGYSSGLAAHHFGSKAALMERVADTVSGDFAAAMLERTTPGATLLDDILVLVDVYFDIVEDPPPVNRARLVLIADAVAHTRADAREVILDADRQFRRFIAGRVHDAIAAGDPVGVDAEAFAVVLVGMLRGITFEAMLDGAVDLTTARAEVTALVTDRLSRPSTARPRRRPARS